MAAMAPSDAPSSLASSGAGAITGQAQPQSPSDIGIGPGSNNGTRMREASGVALAGAQSVRRPASGSVDVQILKPSGDSQALNVRAGAVQQAHVVVRQALKQQEALTFEQQRQVQTQVMSLQKLLQSQAAGMLQTMSQIRQLQAELEPQLGEAPQLRGQFDNLQQTQLKLGSLHQMLQGQLVKLQQSQSQAHQAHLFQTQGHIGSLYKMIQVQGAQLQSTQTQVAELTASFGRARTHVQLATQAQDARLEQTQAQVLELQAKLEEHHATQVSLQQQITARASTPTRLSSIAAAGAAVLGSPMPMASARSCNSDVSIGADRAVVKARIEELEAELIKLEEFVPDSDEESV